MAPVQPAYVMQNQINHPAQLFRMALAGLSPASNMPAGATAPGGGVHPAWGNQLQVTGTAGLSVNVGTGLVYLPGTTAWQGAYAGYNTSSFAVTIPTVSGTQWRRDYIVAKQDDTAFGDADDNWLIEDIQGTNSSSAPGALPTLPPNCVPLAIVACTPGMTVTNAGGTVSDARQYSSLPGPIPTTSANKPSLSCPEGTMWYEKDTHSMGIIVNGAYVYLFTTLGASAVNFWTTSNQTISSTSPVPVNGLSTTVQAGATYRIHGRLTALAVTAGSILRLRFTGPTVSAMEVEFNWESGSTGGTGSLAESLTAMNTPTTQTIALATGTKVFCDFDGIITFSSAGTFNLAAAVGTSGVNGTIQSMALMDVIPA
jgi:hypothetical protein